MQLNRIRLTDREKIHTPLGNSIGMKLGQWFILVVTLVLLISPNTFASTSLGVVILPTSLPGLIMDNPGPTNGPLSGDTGLVSGLIPYVVKVSGSGTAYIRTWSDSKTGDQVSIEAIESNSFSGMATAYQGIKQALLSVSGQVSVVKTFSIRELPNAIGTTLVDKASGKKVTAQQVAFLTKNTIFIVRLDSQVGHFQPIDAEKLAESQSGRALSLLPNAPNSFPWYIVWIAVGLMAIGMSAIFFKLTRKESK
ncbi:MAG: hypothetical protein HKL80_04645 [Acidimicrobiales bacterium]|nr:hypothetical protein [Acidimicrobiales bacterium]